MVLGNGCFNRGILLHLLGHTVRRRRFQTHLFTLTPTSLSQHGMFVV